MPRRFRAVFVGGDRALLVDSRGTDTHFTYYRFTQTGFPLVEQAIDD